MSSVTTLSSFHGYDADVELVSIVVEAASLGIDMMLHDTTYLVLKTI